jgi:hypothetical protein
MTRCVAHASRCTLRIRAKVHVDVPNREAGALGIDVRGTSESTR